MTAAAAPHRKFAIAVDGRPAHGPLAPIEQRSCAIRDITTALGTGKSPAFGFLNAGFGLATRGNAARAIAG